MRVRPVHYILAAVIAAAIAVGWLENKPVASEFVPELHDKFKGRWIEKNKDLGAKGFEENWDKRIHITYWEKWDDEH